MNHYPLPDRASYSVLRGRWFRQQDFESGRGGESSRFVESLDAEQRGDTCEVTPGFAKTLAVIAPTIAKVRAYQRFPHRRFCLTGFRVNRIFAS